MKKITLILIISFLVNYAKGQCTAPSFNVNLSATADTVYTLSSVTRNGVCCGSSNCVTFNVTLNPNTEIISFNVTSPSPSGSAYYQVNCGTPVSIGTPLCVVGIASPFTITYCKPGGDSPNYIISAGTIVHASNDISIHNTNCTDTLYVSNVETSSIIWKSIYPGVAGAYNNYLSCTSGCTSTLVTAVGTPPPYVDFQVSGNPTTTCGAMGQKDTVRVYFVNPLTGTITPTNPIICSGSGTVLTLTANPIGGSAPYSYTWTPSQHNQTFNVNSAGTYTVIIGDNTRCPRATVTKVVASSPSATFSYNSSGSAYCKNGSNPSPQFTGTGQAGTFTATPAGLLFVSTNTGQINLASSAPGTYTVTNTIPATASCASATSTTIVTINPIPVMTSSSTATVCSGNTVNIPLTGTLNPTFTWIATDNINIEGESLTTETTSTLNNTLTNNTTTAKIIVYTVTPTATISGGCTGNPQTVNVTVNPMDDPNFTYSSSTNCKTGTNPTTTITGLSGGTFTSSAGLVFVSSSSGTVNLSASNLGSYIVTYTTNGVCPSTQTFPITITVAPSATFSYTGTPYCQNASNPSPTFAAGAGGGTFTSAPGLVFVNNLTGEINLAASTPGTYTVTNTIAAASGCAAATATSNVTITQLKVATFSYTGSPYCKNSSNPLPTFSNGGVAGTFSAPAGLNINSSTGLVNLSASTSGTYTVTNTIAATGGCPSVISTSAITITTLPVASFSYTGTPYCQNGTNPSPIFTGGGVAGVFNASSVFLSLNSGTGFVNLASSTSDSYLVTNTIAAANGCPEVTATAPITITELPIANFNYTASPYCSNAANPTPQLNSGGSNGIFTSSPSGLTIDANAGTVNISASTSGNYTVTNTIAAAGGCPVVTAINSIVINPIATAAAGNNTTICAGNTYTSLGSIGGGASSLTWSSNGNGTFNDATLSNAIYSPSANDISAGDVLLIITSNDPAGSCSAVSDTMQLTITPRDNATFNYGGSTFCQTGLDPIPTITGLIGGTFSSSSSSLSINSTTGMIDLSTSSLGTYTVKYYTSGPCPDSTTVNVTVTTAPSASFNYAALQYCSSATDPLAIFPVGSSGGVFTSTAGLMIDSISGSIDLSGSAIGNYNITNTIAAAGGCASAIGNASIEIFLAATVLAGNDDAICSGSNYVLNGVKGGGTSSITWGTSGNGTFNDANSETATYTPSADDIIAGSVILTITSNDPAGPCSLVSDGMILTIYPAVTISAGTDTAICSGNNYTLAGMIGGGATSLTWSSSGTGTFDNASLAAATYTPSADDITAGSVLLAITSNDPTGPCNMRSDTLKLTISPAVIISAGSDTTICSGINYTLSGMIGGGASSLTWSSSGNGTFDNVNLATATYTPSADDITAGSVTLIITSNDPSGPCNALNDAIVLTINPAATISSGNSTTICSGTNYSLSGIAGGGASTLTWSSNGNGTFDDPTLATATYTPSADDITSGSVILTITSDDPAGTCNAVMDTMVLTIDPAATVNAGNNATICAGTNYLLSGIIGGGATSLTWSSNGNGTFDDATIANATYTPSADDIITGSVALILTSNDPSGPCVVTSDAMILTITPRDNATFNYPGSTFCQSGIDPIPVITGLTGGSFSASSAALSVNSTTGEINLASSALGSYIVTYTTVGPCPDSTTVNVTITNAPTATFSFAGSSYCSNAADPLPAFPIGGSGGIFTSASGLIIDQISGLVDLSASTPGTYTINNLIAASGGCATASANFNITINALDDASFSYSSIAYCQSVTDQNPSITGTSGGIFTSTTGLILDPSTGAINVAGSNSGTYPITYSTNGTCPNSSLSNITVNPLPRANTSSNILMDCGSRSISIDASGSSSGAGITYLWNTVDGNIVSGNTTTNPSINQIGTYYITVTDNNGCSASDTTVVITSSIVPIASFTTNPSILTGPAPLIVELNNTSQNSNTYVWDLGDGSPLLNTDSSTYTFTNPGTYLVILSSSNNGSCGDTASVIVRVTEPLNNDDAFMIPQGFSPNGDGTNDQFVIKGLSKYPDNKISIFNRWGNKVYEAIPYSNDWDGTVTKGLHIGDNILPVGTYFYVIDLGDGSKEIKGNIYLNK